MPWLLWRACCSTKTAESQASCPGCCAGLHVSHARIHGEHQTCWGSVTREAGGWSIAWEASWRAVARHAVARRGAVACTHTTQGQPHCRADSSMQGTGTQR